MQQTVSPELNGAEDFERWRVYRTAVSIPESMSGATAFKVFFTDVKGQTQSHYFLKSDVGLRTKIA